MLSLCLQNRKIIRKTFSKILIGALIVSLAVPPSMAQSLPPVGTMLSLSSGYTPTIVRGLVLHPENLLVFDFVVDTGNTQIQGKELSAESNKLIKYFLASLTIPEEEKWVNLSPYEKDRIISKNFGTTDMGKDLLEQDYILKQLTASLIYPDSESGKKFWDKIYKKTKEASGGQAIPVNTFNKVWIIPDVAQIYEKDNSAFVLDSHLKVMLEEDYLAVQNNNINTSTPSSYSKESSQIIREVILPEIEKEVNEGKTFANLRQIYNSMILATWYKKRLRESILGQIYVNKSKTKGVEVADKQINQKIYEQYLEAFKQGVYNYIKEDYDPATQETIPRKYFSGGFSFEKLLTTLTIATAGLIGYPTPADAKFADVSQNWRSIQLVTWQGLEISPKMPTDVLLSVENNNLSGANVPISNNSRSSSAVTESVSTPLGASSVSIKDFTLAGALTDINLSDFTSEILGIAAEHPIVAGATTGITILGAYIGIRVLLSRSILFNLWRLNFEDQRTKSRALENLASIGERTQSYLLTTIENLKQQNGRQPTIKELEGILVKIQNETTVQEALKDYPTITTFPTMSSLKLWKL